MAYNCDVLPNFQPSDEINLKTCTAVGSSWNEQGEVFLFRVLNQMKWGDIQVTLEGIGFDCNPVTGLAMAEITVSGNSTPCKAFVGHETSFGCIRCTHPCSCSSGCAMFRAAVTNTAGKVICSVDV